MDVGFRTDKGAKRSNNEDAFFVMKNDGVYIVADGVGGNNSGEIASRTAVNEIATYVEEHPMDPRDVRGFFLTAAQKANARVYEMSQRYREDKGMATTLVIACFLGKELWITNVGDSRVYLCDRGGMIQVTEDHTYVNALVQAGVITKDEAKHHMDKNMITRAVGADREVDPDFYRVRLRPGMKVLLCTDGLHGEVSEDEMAQIFAQGMSMTDTCRELVDAANRNGGGDNITAVCIEVTEEDLK